MEPWFPSPAKTLILNRSVRRGHTCLDNKSTGAAFIFSWTDVRGHLFHYTSRQSISRSHSGVPHFSLICPRSNPPHQGIRTWSQGRALFLSRLRPRAEYRSGLSRSRYHCFANGIAPRTATPDQRAPATKSIAIVPITPIRREPKEQRTLHSVREFRAACSRCGYGEPCQLPP
jgi:hypothetical protein